MAREGDYVHGRHAVSELLQARPEMVRHLYVASSAQAAWMTELVARAKHAQVDVQVVPKRTLLDMVGQVAHQGVVAAVARFRYAALEDVLETEQANPMLVALDQIQDPHNLGAILRSSQAFGVSGAIVPKDRSADMTPAAIKAAAGAAAHIPVARVTNLRRALREAQQAGFWVVGTVAEGGEVISEVDLVRPLVWVVGSEGKGLRRGVAQGCDMLVRIPIAAQIGSLNASVAAGIALYEAARQRS